MAKGEEEDVVGNYFKPIRASRLMAQAQETQRGKGNSKLCHKDSVISSFHLYKAVWSTPNFSSSGGLVWDSYAAQHQFPRGTHFKNFLYISFVLELSVPVEKFDMVLKINFALQHLVPMDKKAV